MPRVRSEERKAYQRAYIRKHYQENKDYYRERNKRRKKTMPLEAYLFEVVRIRARNKGVPFSIEVSDIVIPKRCPVFGRPLVRRDVNWGASVDRIIPALGYIKGNIAVISKRANRIKNDATPQELMALAKWAAANNPSC